MWMSLMNAGEHLHRKHITTVREYCRATDVRVEDLLALDSLAPTACHFQSTLETRTPTNPRYCRNVLSKYYYSTRIPQKYPPPKYA